MVRGKVLIIDDDRGTRDGLRFAFIRRDWEVVVTETEAEGRALLTDYTPDWVIVAWDQLGGTGSVFLREVRARARRTRVSLLTEPGAHAGRFGPGLRPDLTFPKPVHADDVYGACDALTSGDPVVGRAV